MRHRLFLIALVAVCLASAASAQTNGNNDLPPDFESDGCTFFPDGNYRDCCVEHDKDYFKGGSCKERRKSDNRLYRCVKSKKGWQNKVIAPIMWVGVRVAGVPFLPTPFRWGFGKKKYKKYKESLSKPESGPPQEPAPNPASEIPHLDPVPPPAHIDQ